MKQNHGRSYEVDYISCTSNELPFVAAVTLHELNEYKELYAPSDGTCTWSEERKGIRMRIKVITELPSGYSVTILQSLLRQALKEMLIRRNTSYVDVDNV